MSRSPNLGPAFSPKNECTVLSVSPINSHVTRASRQFCDKGNPSPSHYHWYAQKRSPIAVAVSAEIAINCVPEWKVEILICDVGVWSNLKYTKLDPFVSSNWPIWFDRRLCHELSVLSFGSLSSNSFQWIGHRINIGMVLLIRGYQYHLLLIIFVFSIMLWISHTAFISISNFAMRYSSCLIIQEGQHQ